MLFKPQMIDAILDGRKTETRRIVKESETWSEDHKSVFDSAGKLKWRVGKTYPIQPGMFKKSVARFILTDIDQQFLWEMKPSDAIREGISLTEKQKMARYHYIDRKILLPADFEYKFNLPWILDEYLAAFAYLWDTINNQPNCRWEDNPKVWRLQFLFAFYSPYGRERGLHLVHSVGQGPLEGA